MNVKLYGLPTCSRCKSAKMMLDKRNIKYEYTYLYDLSKLIVNDINTEDLPILKIDDNIFKAKDALKRIRELESYEKKY